MTAHGDILYEKRLFFNTVFTFSRRLHFFSSARPQRIFIPIKWCDIVNDGIL
jgi:hypothetical protein